MKPPIMEDLFAIGDFIEIAKARDLAGQRERGRRPEDPYEGDVAAELVTECADGFNYANRLTAEGLYMGDLAATLRYVGQVALKRIALRAKRAEPKPIPPGEGEEVAWGEGSR